MNTVRDIVKALEFQMSESKWPGYVYSYPHKKAYRTVEHLNLAKVWPVGTADLNLYVHVPFCIKRCSYCNLFLIPLGEPSKNQEYVDRYIDALLRQIEFYTHFFKTPSPNIHSLYFGGGTPNYLSIAQLTRIMNALRTEFPNWIDGIEPCMEASPYLFNEAYIAALAELGFGRISMGIQSLNEDDLKIMNRDANPTTILDVYALLKKYGLGTNVDMIYGLQNQNMQAMQTNLKKLLALSPHSENISLYPLVIRPETGFGKQVAKRSLPMADDTVKYKFFEWACEYLSQNGYEWQSSVRFALRDTASTYAQQTLEFAGMSTLGLGAGARSYAPNHNYAQPYQVARGSSKAIIETYINADFGAGIPFDVFHFSKDELRRKFITFSLLKGKLDVNKYEDEFAESPLTAYANEFVALFQLGLLDQGEVYRLTQKGKRYHDIVVNLFESEAVKQKISEYVLN